MNVMFSELAELFPAPATLPAVTGWVSVRDELPEQGSIVPVWDGDYIYYASYWIGKMSGYHLWIISDAISPCKENVDLMKGAGEQVYPIHWMRLAPPPKRR